MIRGGKKTDDVTEFIPLEACHGAGRTSRPFRRSGAGTDRFQHHHPHRAGGPVPIRNFNGRIAAVANGGGGGGRAGGKRECQADANAPYHVAWPVVGQIPDTENLPPNAVDKDEFATETDLHPEDDGAVDGNVVWKSKGKIYSKDVLGLHEEIEDFYQWMMPTKTEHDARVSVVARIRSLIHKIWPDTVVDIFGSFKTGLYLPTSDIDLVISGNWSNLPLYKLKLELEASGIPRLDNLLVLDKAAVPIVKMTDKQAGINVDISFNTVNGIRAAELIKFYKKTYPPLSKLIYVLKQFLLQRGLNEVFQGGLSSYALILMAVSFLQLHQRPDVKQNDANLGVLLIEFFELYGRDFNYAQSAIRLRDGGGFIPKEQFVGQMPHLAPNQSGGGMFLCVEDPLDAHNDVGKGSYQFYRVKDSFEEAYKILTKVCLSGNEDPSGTKSILNHIISVSDQVKEFRQRLEPLPMELSLKTSANDVYTLSSNDLPERPYKQKPETKENSIEFKVPVDPQSAKEETDNMSSVSTSVASSCCDSDGSPSGPNSEMSISPTNSEVESKFSQKPPSYSAAAASRRTLSSTMKRSSMKKRQDRADLDPDWRNSGVISSESSGDANSSDSNSPARPNRTDQDPNWKSSSPKPWKAVRNQYCAPGEKSTGSVKEKRPPGFAATAIQMAPPTTTQSDRVAGESHAISNENFVNAKVRTRKLKKKKKSTQDKDDNANDCNDNDGDDSSDSLTNNGQSSRFSRVQGQQKAKR